MDHALLKNILALSTQMISFRNFNLYSVELEVIAKYLF